MKKSLIYFLLAFGFVGCDSHGDPPLTPLAPFGGAIPGVATTSPSVSISSISCTFPATSTVSTTGFSFVVTSTVSPLQVNNVMFRTITGNSLGGPTVTIPSAALSQQVGSTFIPAGTSQPFGVTALGFPCTPGQVVQVNVVVTNVNNVIQTISTTGTVH